MISTPSMKWCGIGHAHARVAQAVDHVDLGRAPGRLVLRAAVPRALVHGALVAAVAHLAPLGVLGAVLERAVLRLLVDLGDALLAAGDDQVDLGLLAAHQRAHHFFDDPVVDQRLEALGNSHTRHRSWQPTSAQSSADRSEAPECQWSPLRPTSRTRLSRSPGRGRRSPSRCRRRGALVVGEVGEVPADAEAQVADDDAVDLDGDAVGERGAGAVEQAILDERVPARA